MKIDLKMSTAKHYRSRVFAIKDKLPRTYRKILYSHYPELTSKEGRELIDLVMRGLKTHVQLTEALEAIAAGELKLKGAQELELNSAA